MGWREALLPYRAADNFQGAALVAQDKHLLRLAATWPLVPRTLPDPPGPGEEVDLDEVWRQTLIDFQGWAALSQLPHLVVMEGFKALKGGQVILPDGTLNHAVEALLQKEAAGQFMAKLNIKPGDLK
ncbi:MAG: hypothetical protein ACP5PX_07970 [Candidatus Hadarchaeum sp.]|uniref:hypothetical protein n=1 Tax=Candidatus Hadarchaeum sp. TaxID=2883567 RepID=UPI003D096075